MNAKPSNPPAFPCELIGGDFNGMTLRDWFAGQAPSIPSFVMEKFLRVMETNEPEAMELPWNEFMLKRLATQEARWRGAFADAMLAERERVK